MDFVEYRGGASRLTLTDPLVAGALTARVAGNITGWPTGVANTRPFVAELELGTTNSERVLCSGLSGVTLTILQRGYDGTQDISHLANATIDHTLAGITINELVKHVGDDLQDDHGQYLTNERHDDPSRHVFGVAFSEPGNPADVGVTADPGVSELVAREDHVHLIGSGAINSAGQFAAGVIDTAAIADDAVTEDKIFDGAVMLAKMGTDAIALFNSFVSTLADQSGLIAALQSADNAIGASNIASGYSLVTVAATAPATPFDGQQWYDTTTARSKVWHAASSAWRIIGGAMPRLATTFGLVDGHTGWALLTRGGGAVALTEVETPTDADGLHTPGQNYAVCPEAGLYLATMYASTNNSNEWVGTGFSVTTGAWSSGVTHPGPDFLTTSAVHPSALAHSQVLRVAAGQRVYPMIYSNNPTADVFTQGIFELTLIGY